MPGPIRSGLQKSVTGFHLLLAKKSISLSARQCRRGAGHQDQGLPPVPPGGAVVSRHFQLPALVWPAAIDAIS